MNDSRVIRLVSRFRNHWFDIGIIICLFLILYLLATWTADDMIRNILILNLIVLLIHQYEEYRFPGGFPFMMNKIIFKSSKPDRYPLNSNSAFIINVVIGWTSYLVAILLSDKIIIGVLIIFASFGNAIAHTVIFNIKGKTLYNPGMISSVVMFLPLSFLFVHYTNKLQMASFSDWVIGILLGMVLSLLSIFMIIEVLKDEHTKFVFRIQP